MKLKPNIILDLDQTIISGEPCEDFDFKKYKNKLAKFNFKIMEDYYIIVERPNLQEFLTFIFKNFNVSVWTAASKDYALFIINKIIIANKKNRVLDYIFFSYHCTISKKLKKKKSKNLSILWEFFKINYNENNTFILDDFDEVYNTQKNNCIIAKPFEFTENKSEKDTFLKDLIPKLKKYILKNPSDIKNNISIINDDLK
jgi:TFIIF-interacting CTD phosphatase-like protein